MKLLPIEPDSFRKPRWVAYAYDISAPRRARSVRALLARHAANHQYSVRECYLSTSHACDLLAEIECMVDSNSDRVSMWWPSTGTRVSISAGEATSCRRRDGIVQSAGLADVANALQGAGNYLISYDIADDMIRRRTHALVARGGAMVQRSVYLWRSTHRQILTLTASIRPSLESNDCVWIHPLLSLSRLWTLGSEPGFLLPINR